MLYSVRSERQLMEQMDYNLLFRWFVGLGIDDPVWGEGRLGIDPADQFNPERAEPRGEGRRCSRRTATGC
ncbi:transposase [Jannaschia formosa]|uniref:transposase n=1 Tax=Jannaschia formosa TaxID=2259592 RepID=UPI003F972D1C